MSKKRIFTFTTLTGAVTYVLYLMTVAPYAREGARVIHEKVTNQRTR